MGDEVGTAARLLHVTVCYALADHIWLREITVPMGTTVMQALEASGFTAAFPQVNPLAHGLAIYGQACAPEQILCEGERIDILRPLAFDPKESRRRRVEHRRAAMARRASH